MSLTNLPGGSSENMEKVKKLMAMCADKDQEERGVNNPKQKMCQTKATVAKALAQIVSITSALFSKP